MPRARGVVDLSTEAARLGILDRVARFWREYTHGPHFPMNKVNHLGWWAESKSGQKSYLGKDLQEALPAVASLKRKWRNQKFAEVLKKDRS